MAHRLRTDQQQDESVSHRKLSSEDGWDLLVIGAGPAGCAAAITARQAGLCVLLLEAAVSFKRRPGETLHPGMEPILHQLGVWPCMEAAGFHRHEGVWTTWDGPRTFHPYGRDARGSWQGIQAERARFDALMAEAALRAGVTFLRPCRAIKVIRDAEGTVTGVDTTHGVKHARWVADATGQRAWLANQLRLEATYFSPVMIIKFGWRARPRCDEDANPSFNASSGGWNWEAPIDDNNNAWVILRLADSADHGSTGLSDKATGMQLRWRLHDSSAGKGYFLLGDAAALLDPSSSHGVLRAMMSGMLASRLIATHRDDVSTNLCGRYRAWMRGQFEKDVAALKALWNRHPDPASRQAMAAK